MSKKRFLVVADDLDKSVSIKDTVKRNYPFSICCESIDDYDILISECMGCCYLLNEQEALIKAKDRVISAEKSEKKLLLEEIKEIRDDLGVLMEITLVFKEIWENLGVVMKKKRKLIEIEEIRDRLTGYLELKGLE